MTMTNFLNELFYRQDTYTRAYAKGDNYVMFSVPHDLFGELYGKICRMARELSFSNTVLPTGRVFRIEGNDWTVIFRFERVT